MTSTQFVKFLTTLPPPSHDKLLCVYAVSLNLPFCADVTIGRSLGSRRTAERKNERAREHTYTISLKFPSGIYGPTLLPPPFRTAADATQGWNGQPPRSSERASERGKPPIKPMKTGVKTTPTAATAIILLSLPLYYIRSTAAVTALAPQVLRVVFFGRRLRDSAQLFTLQSS